MISLQDRSDLYLEDEALEALLSNIASRRRSELSNSHPVQGAESEDMRGALENQFLKTFQRTRPRFPGQNFDVYAQKAHNLQVWNQEIAASRRYVVVQVDTDGVAERLKVVRGEVLARYDVTGTLTSKYQAKSRTAVRRSALVSPTDTLNVRNRAIKLRSPALRGFLPIRQLFDRLIRLVGSKSRIRGEIKNETAAGHFIRQCADNLPRLFRRTAGSFRTYPINCSN